MTQNFGKILFLEDELNLGETLAESLERAQYVVTWCKTCSEANQVLGLNNFDLALLDVSLPDGSGYEVAKNLLNRNKSGPQTAIIFLTAFSTAEDRIRGLELGADDFIGKPFHLKELLLRVKNVLSRRQRLTTDSEKIVRINGNQFEIENFRIVKGESEHLLSHRECSFLNLLWKRRNHVVSRDQIIEEVCSGSLDVSPRSIDNMVVKLRKLIEAVPGEQADYQIRSHRGVGYSLSASTEETREF